MLVFWFNVYEDKPWFTMTLRLVLLFVLTAIVPVLIVYTFSIWLLERGVDSWFDVKVESALQDAVDLSRSSLDMHIRTLGQQVEPLVNEFADKDSFMQHWLLMIYWEELVLQTLLYLTQVIE